MIYSYYRRSFKFLIIEVILQKILFAGEATSTERFSTVDGAISSGWKAADRLIDYYESAH